MKKFKHIFLGCTATLTLSSVLLAPTAQASGSTDNQQLAASIIQFLSNAMYPDSSNLGNNESNLLKPSKKINNTTKSLNKDLTLSSLSSAVATKGAPLVQQSGVQVSSDKNIGKQYSHQKMASFLCGDGSSKCLYTPKHSNALMQTLIGSPFASKNGGLTAADTLLSKSEVDSTKSAFSYDGNSSDNKYTGSYDKSAYFNYNTVFGAHQPNSLEPAKYYGLFATDSYDVTLMNQEPDYVAMIRKALNSGNTYALRNNKAYQQHVLLARKLTATNSALMGNVLWLAKQHTVSVPKAKSPTGKALSQAQVDHYLGNHRLNDNGQWLEKIKNESPTELLREQTLMLAEANHQRQESNEMMKRVLMTVTILAAENKELYKMNAALQAKLLNAGKS